MKIYLQEMVVMQRTSRDVLWDLNISIKCENDPLQHVHEKTVVRVEEEVLDLIDKNGNIEEFEQILKQQIVQKSMNINPFLCRLL
jgi:hypothetical protein